MKRIPPSILFAAAAVVLSLALAHFFTRVTQQDSRTSVMGAQERRLQEETAARKAELERDRASVVGRIQALQQAGDHVGAMQIAGRYHLVQDPEILALYRQSADSEGRRQRLAETRKLIQEQCTQDAAWKAAEEALQDLDSAGVLAHRNELELTRAKVSDVLPLILAQLRGEPGASLPNKPDPKEPPGHEHHVQVHSDYAMALSSGTPDQDLICAWRVAARPGASRALQRFELVFWRAPMPNKLFATEALRYTPPAAK